MPPLYSSITMHGCFVVVKAALNTVTMCGCWDTRPIARHSRSNERRSRSSARPKLSTFRATRRLKSRWRALKT